MNVYGMEFHGSLISRKMEFVVFGFRIVKT